MCRRKPGAAVVAVVFLLSVAACNRTPEKAETQQTPAQKSVEKSVNQIPAASTPVAEAKTSPAADVPKPEEPKVEAPAAPSEPPAKPTMPEVKLSEALAVTCLVKVGDALPEGTLADREGRVVESRSLLGPKLTVLCFWNGGDLSAMDALRQLGKHVAEPYADKGVRVAAVNEGDSPREAAEKLKEANVAFPCLLDPGGAYFAKIAIEGLPRIYLIDSQGNILWFDTQYSRGTKRDLLQAIEAVMAQ